MSDMLETFVRKEITNEIKTNYPHIQYPAGMYARIVQAKQDAKNICTLSRFLTKH